METRKCPICGRDVTVTEDDVLCTHGPGPEKANGRCDFICPGSGDKAFMDAAKNLEV